LKGSSHGDTMRRRTGRSGVLRLLLRQSNRGDPVSLKLTPRLTKAARALAGLGIDDLAREASVDRSDLAAFESGPERPAAMAGLDAVVAALERAGVSFIVEDELGVGVRLRPPGDGATLPVSELNASNDD
jgi:hypothetical protein